MMFSVGRQRLWFLQEILFFLCLFGFLVIPKASVEQPYGV